MLSRGRGHDIVGSRFPDGLSAKTLRASEFGLLRGQVQPSAVFLGEIKYAETISATRPRLRSANFVPSARDLLALGNHSTRSGEFPWGWQSTSSLTQPHGNSVEVILGRQLRETSRLKPKNLTTFIIHISRRLHSKAFAPLLANLRVPWNRTTQGHPKSMTRTGQQQRQPHIKAKSRRKHWRSQSRRTERQKSLSLKR